MIDVDFQAVVLPIVVFLTMFSVGLDLEVKELSRVVKNPRIAVIGTVIQTFTFPILAMLLVGTLVTLQAPVTDSVLIGILLIAACPSGGFSNVLVLIAKADLALSVILTTISTVLSFVTIPLFFWCFALLLPTGPVRVQISVSDTLLQLLLLILLPVTMGGYCRHRWPEITKKVRSSFQRAIQLVLYLVVAVIFYQQWNVVSATLVPALSWSLGLCFGTLAIGYSISLLTRLPHPVCATVAIECSIRNLAVAFLVASNVLNRMDVAVIPTVYFMAVLFVGFGFSLSWKRVYTP